MITLLGFGRPKAVAVTELYNTPILLVHKSFDWFFSVFLGYSALCFSFLMLEILEETLVGLQIYK